MRSAALALVLLAAASPAAALSLPFWGRDATEAPPAPPRPVVTEIVEANGIHAGRSIPGAIAAATEVRMAFQTLGRMTDRPVDMGDRVRAGDLLARLDPEDLAGTTRAAEAALAAAEVNLTTTANTAERVRALARRNVASDAQLERAEQALSAARSAVDQARAQLESARDAERYAVMTAPIAGVVSDVRAAPGAVVAAGDPILTLSSEDDLEAVVDLTEAQLRGILPTTELLVWRDRDTDAPVSGRVDRIAPVADIQTRTWRVHIELPPGTGFRLGSLIRVSLAGGAGGALTVPTAALVHRAEGPAVWTVRRDAATATVALTPVAIGAVSGARVEVSSGLAAGDEVVIRGVNSLTDGQAVGRRVAP